jgi:outer membrane immunogenic protein
VRNCVVVAIFLAILGVSPALAQSPAKSWTGAYIGAHVGADWGDVTVRDNAADGVAPGPFKYSANGIFGGGTAGFNWQVQGLVLGIEGDLGYMDLSGAGIIPSSSPTSHQDITLRHGMYGDITARLGYAMGHTLFYAKGGFAFYDGEAMQATTKPGYAPSGTDTFTGWTVGGGAEMFISRDFSIKIEYQHFDFGTQSAYQTATVADPPTPVGYKFYNWHDVTADTVKIGGAYHF